MMQAALRNGVVFVFLFLACPGNVFSQNLQWVRKLESNAAIKISDMIFGQNSSVYALLNYSGSVDVDPGGAVYQLNAVGQTDFCLLHVLANGTLGWAKAFGGVGADYAYALEFDAAGNIVVVGSFSSVFDFFPGPASISVMAYGQKDAFLAVYDLNGDYLSHRTFGNTGTDEVFDICRSPNGSFLLTGCYQGTVDFDPGIGQNYQGTTNGLVDMFVSSFDASLNFQWAKCFGGTGVTRSVKLDTDAADNLYLCGYFSGIADFDPSNNPLFLPAGGISAFIISLNASGQLRRLGFLNTSAQCFPLGMEVGNNGTLTLCGRFNGITDLHPDTNAQLLVNGSAQGDDAFMLLLDTNLNVLWHKTIISSYADAVTTTAFLPDGNIIFSGYFNGVYDFMDGPRYAIAGNENESRAFILHLDSACRLIGVKDFGSDGTFPSLLSISPLGLMLLSGNYSGSTNMDPDTGSFNLSGNNFSQVFLARYWFCNPLSLPDSIAGDTVLCSSSSSQFLAFGADNPVWYYPPSWSINALDSTLYVHTGMQGGWIQVASSGTCGIGPAIALPVVIHPVDVSIQNTSGALWSPNYNASSYQWLDCNNGYLPVSGASFQLFWPPAPGNYAVQIQQGSCTDTSVCENVLITSSPHQTQQVSFFPNPASSFTRISLNEPLANLKACSPDGAYVPLCYSVSDEVLTIDLSTAPAGLLLLEITFRNGNKLHTSITHI